MKTYTLMIEDSGDILLADENGMMIDEKDEILEYLAMEQERKKIYKSLQNEEGLLDQPEIMQNLNLVIRNYQIEMHANAEINHFNILRLALASTREDLENH